MGTNRMIITIDGPTASGKSTVAKRLAQELGIYYLGTGLMFRGAAYLLKERAGYKISDLSHPNPDDVATYLDCDRFVYDASGRILFDGQDLTPYLKKSDMDIAASIVSTNKTVRQALLAIQRACGKKLDLVVEGRDVGSVVFPEAQAKFFLTASVPVRARRWQDDQEKKGNRFSLDEAIEKITARDRRDMERDVAPLIKPHDAIEIDNSTIDLQKTVELMKGLIIQKGYR